MKKIGIIGGAGPEAGASLFMHIVRSYQQRGAVHDGDFPYIIHLNIPFAPMLTEKDITQNRIVLQNQLQEAFNSLTSCDVVAIACNTLHTLLGGVSFQKSRFVSIVEATHVALNAKGVTKVLFLGTSTSVALELYKGSASLTYPNADEQRDVDQIIMNVLANDFSDSQRLARIIEACRKRDAFDGIILGCTELPLLNQKNFIVTNLPLFDTISILADRIVDFV